MPTVAPRIEMPPIGYSNYSNLTAGQPHVNGREVLTDTPTEDTVMAMQETMNDIKNGNVKVFYSSDELIKELKAGEESGMIADFDRNQALSNLHAKYLHNGV